MIILRQRAYANVPLNLGDTSKLKVVGTSPTTTGAPYRPMNDPGRMKMNNIVNKSYDAGRKSVGIWGGAKNTWGGMNNTQKGLAIGGAATIATLGTAATIGAIRNRNKRKQAERDLELERARNSRPRY